MRRKRLTKNIYILLLITGVIVLSGCGRKKAEDGQAGFEIIQPYERGPFSVSQKIDKSKIGLAELINMQLVAVCGEGYEVNINDIEAGLEDFSIVKWKKENDSLDPNNNIVRTYNYQLEPFSDGILKVPAITFKFTSTGDDKKTSEIVTEALDIEVVTTIAADPNSGVEIADIADVVEMKNHAFVWILAGLGVLVVFVAVMALIYSRRKQLNLPV